ncbi:MAG TPA: hypothetical protein VHV81_05770 [Steroidobacteraceae bacterium]|nr:hypothetical protein [Steroidobacteraceae bacterium]
MLRRFTTRGKISAALIIAALLALGVRYLGWGRGLRGPPSAPHSIVASGAAIASNPDETAAKTAAAPADLIASKATTLRDMAFAGRLGRAAGWPPAPTCSLPPRDGAGSSSNLRETRKETTERSTRAECEAAGSARSG